MRRKFVIGSRGSALALWQANFVKERLQHISPESSFELKVIKTTGDEFADVALSKINDKGLFTRQIERQLLDGDIDLAVHSLKDLQTTSPTGLTIGSVCKRELANDVLVSRKYSSISDLPAGASIATGSLRRRSQLKSYRPDLNIVDIRGNVPTRLKKVDESDIDALVLAYAGLHRLGFDGRISELIPFEIMLPAVGQGAIAVQVRENDETVADLALRLDDAETRTCTDAERAFLRRLEGGCQVPIGAHATLVGDTIALEGMVGSLDGAVIFRDRRTGPADDPESLGTVLAELLIEKGAAGLLSDVRSAAMSSET